LTKSILIVDDHRYIRAALRLFVERNTQMSVCGEAADGLEAIDKALDLNPDLILMDVSMPNMNGLEAAATIRKLLPGTPIVVFTLFSEALGKGVSKAAGVDVVVSKADGAAGLLNAL
jgi:DNA-binding NarL/FixJ family response regulator